MALLSCVLAYQRRSRCRGCGRNRGSEAGAIGSRHVAGRGTRNARLQGGRSGYGASRVFKREFGEVAGRSVLNRAVQPRSTISQPLQDRFVSCRAQPCFKKETDW